MQTILGIIIDNWDTISAAIGAAVGFGLKALHSWFVSKKTSV